MKKVFFTLALSMIFSTMPLLAQNTGAFPRVNQNDVRIANYYTRYCYSPTLKNVDVNRIANVIDKLDADIVCIQQLDSCTSRSNNEIQTNKLAELTHMHGYFMKTATLNDGGAQGQVILTRDKPLSVQYIHLPGKKEKRGAVIVEFEKYVVASTHFDTDSTNRITALTILKEKLSAYNKTAFISGYFNEGNLNSEFFKKVMTDWTIQNERVATENSRKKRELDFIVSLNSDHSPNCTNTKVVTSLEGLNLIEASLHYPVFCDFKDLRTKSTNILHIDTEQKDNTYYNLQGNKIENPTKAGVYIHHGKKILIK